MNVNKLLIMSNNKNLNLSGNMSNKKKPDDLISIGSGGIKSTISHKPLYRMNTSGMGSLGGMFSVLHF